MSTPPKIPRNDSTRSVLLVTPNENETSSDEDKPKPQENEPEHERVSERVIKNTILTESHALVHKPSEYTKKISIMMNSDVKYRHKGVQVKSTRYNCKLLSKYSFCRWYL